MSFKTVFSRARMGAALAGVLMGSLLVPTVANAAPPTSAPIGGPEYWPIRGSHEIGCTDNNPSPPGGDSCRDPYHGYPAIDIDATPSDKIYSAGVGVVYMLGGGKGQERPNCPYGKVAHCPDQRGNYVTIEHTLADGSKLYSRYLHMTTLNPELSRGTAVTEETWLGFAGTSGLSSPNYTHLHFDVATSPSSSTNSRIFVPLKACVDGVAKTYPRDVPGGPYSNWREVPRNTVIRSDQAKCPTEPPPRPPAPTGPTGSAAGDPHLRSFDGLLYDIQAEGEFRFAESLDDAFSVHVRTRFISSWTGASYVDEYAVRTPEGEIAIYDGSGVHLDGTAVEPGTTVPLEGGGTISDRALVLGDGTTVTWGAASFARSVIVTLAEGRVGRMLGMLGDGDRSPSNDGVTSDGRQILGPGSLDGLEWAEIEAIVYDDFAPSWTVLSTDRLFGGDQRPYVKPTGQMTFEDFATEQVTAAQQLCSDNGWVEPELSFCAFDVLVTGDEGFADPDAIVGITEEDSTSTGGEPQLDPDDGPGATISGKVADRDAVAQDSMCVSAHGVADDGTYQGSSDTTDAAGAYTITGLPDGTYRVSAYECADRDRVAGYHPGMSTYSEAVELRVTATAGASDIDLLTVQGGGLAGTLTRADGGTALAQGDGCVSVFTTDGTTVDYYPYNSSGGGTDDSGAYRIGSLLPGDYLVQASPCWWYQGTPENLANTWYGPASHHQDATPITVAASATTGAVDIALVPGATVTGVVHGPDGQPAQDVCVYGWGTFDRYGEGRTFRTGTDGQYTLTGLSPGDVSIQFSDCANRDFVSASETVTDLAGTEVRAGVDVQLAQGGRIVGTVQSVGTAPIRICVVAMTAAGEWTATSEVLSGQSFALTNLPVDSYTVSFRDCDDWTVIEWWQDAVSEAEADAIPVVAAESTGPLAATVG